MDCLEVMIRFNELAAWMEGGRGDQSPQPHTHTALLSLSLDNGGSFFEHVMSSTVATAGSE